MQRHAKLRDAENAKLRHATKCKTDKFKDMECSTNAKKEKAKSRDAKTCKAKKSEKCKAKRTTP